MEMQCPVEDGPAGLSLALVHLVDAEHEVGAVRSWNTPTVQELLRDASREVCSFMWDVTALDGPGLAAAWPAFAVTPCLRCQYRMQELDC